METIKIRQQGFSHRIGFADFLRRYSFLMFTFEERVIANRETCKLLLIRLNMDGWALGKSKVFLKYYHVEYLSRLYEDEIKKIIRVQAYARRWLAKRRAEREKWSVARSVVIVQKYARGWLARKRLSDIRTNTMMKAVKSSIGSTSPELAPKRRAVESDSGENGHRSRDNSPARAAVMIQKYVRGYLTRKKAKPTQDEVKRLQEQSRHNADSNRPEFPIVPPKQQNQFVSERMQMYQVDSSLEMYNNPSKQQQQRPDNHNNRPKLSAPKQPPVSSMVKKENGRNANITKQVVELNNGQNQNNQNQNQNQLYPQHFAKLELPLNIK